MAIFFAHTRDDGDFSKGLQKVAGGEGWGGREEGAEGGFASFVVLFMLEFKMREFIIWRERERERASKFCFAKIIVAHCSFVEILNIYWPLNGLEWRVEPF